MQTGFCFLAGNVPRETRQNRNVPSGHIAKPDILQPKQGGQKQRPNPGIAGRVLEESLRRNTRHIVVCTRSNAKCHCEEARGDGEAASPKHEIPAEDASTISRALRMAPGILRRFSRAKA